MTEADCHDCWRRCTAFARASVRVTAKLCFRLSSMARVVVHRSTSSQESYRSKPLHRAKCGSIGWAAARCVSKQGTDQSSSQSQLRANWAKSGQQFFHVTHSHTLKCRSPYASLPRSLNPILKITLHMANQEHRKTCSKCATGLARASFMEQVCAATCSHALT
jgi:hypothetical protein